jgi:flagellar motor switch/type III secretory pathway protein FliN
VSASAEVRELCWRDEPQLAALARRLHSALAGWAEDWGLAVPDVHCRNSWEAEATTGGWLALAADNAGAIHVWLSSDADSLGEALFGSQQRGGAQSAPVAKGVGEDALAALRGAINGAMGWREATAPNAGEAAPPATDNQAWSGAVDVRCRIEGAQSFELRLHLRESAWPRPVRALKPGPQGGLGSLSMLLANQPVTVRARMADVTLSLGELMGLRLGDVLVTPQRLDVPLAIEAAQAAEDAAPLFSGRLAQRSGHMAIALASANDRADRQ